MKHNESAIEEIRIVEMIRIDCHVDRLECCQTELIAGTLENVPTMSPYCHVALHEESGLVHGSVVKTDPNADLSGYYKVASGPKQTPYIITGTMMGSSQKSAGKRSRIYLNLKEEKESDEVCCPDAETMLSFVEEDDWFDESVKPIANEYVLGLFNAGEKECQRDMKAWHGPEQIIGIEIATCDW
ncbi:hypothetical protein Y032_0265g662 [Ancylostoma ceylanicum]|uniref:Uncharacterized protein n=1 Tax=Ancylostoma ceylanicum TaxID=53326 RepID=A0A016S9G8_9BILA|nr:hypothetical protein Y032_0265g662 [Ancylostoma ceylanicum]